MGVCSSHDTRSDDPASWLNVDDALETGEAENPIARRCTLHSQYTGSCLRDRVKTTLRIEMDRLSIERPNADTITIPFAAVTDLTPVATPEGCEHPWMLRIHWISWDDSIARRGVADKHHTFHLLCHNAHDIYAQTAMSKSCNHMGLNSSSSV